MPTTTNVIISKLLTTAQQINLHITSFNVNVLNSIPTICFFWRHGRGFVQTDHETKTCPDWVYVRSIGYNLSINVVAFLDKATYWLLSKEKVRMYKLTYHTQHKLWSSSSFRNNLRIYFIFGMVVRLGWRNHVLCLFDYLPFNSDKHPQPSTHQLCHL